MLYIGSIWCKILNYDFNEANQELEFFKETQEQETIPLTHYLDALIEWSHKNNEHNALEMLEFATDEHNKAIKNIAHKYNFFNFFCLFVETITV